MTGLCDGMVDAALCAAEKVLDIYEGDIKVEIKGDETPVTLADKAAECTILSKLASIAPDIPVIAEEAYAEGKIPHVNDAFFLVDPVDGTREFINRNGEFTVNIALIRNGHAEIGVIYAPAKGWIFAGEVGKGAWRAEVRDPRRSHGLADKHSIKVRDPADRPLEIVASRSHHTSEADQYLKSINATECKAIGSSLKFCLLAAGEADLYPRFGPTMEWDTAAGDAILTSAGGRVETVDGERLCYGKCKNASNPFSNPHFIAKGWLQSD